MQEKFGNLHLHVNTCMAINMFVWPIFGQNHQNVTVLQVTSWNL